MLVGFRRKRQNLAAGFSDDNSMLSLGARFAIICSRGPAIRFVNDSFPHTGVDHRLDRKDHAGRHRDLKSIIMMRNFRRLVKGEADAVANELVDDAAARIALNSKF